jgi:inorganic pyrophosphatase
MRDEKGGDEKILSVPAADPRYDGIRELSDMRPHRLREIEHFFEIYKELEDKKVEVLGWHARPEAYEAIEKAIAAYQPSYGLEPEPRKTA